MYVCLCVRAWHMYVDANHLWLPTAQHECWTLNLGLLEEQIFNMVMNNIYKRHYFWLYLTGKINGLAIFFIFGKQAIATMRLAYSLCVEGKLGEYACLVCAVTQ